MRHPVLASVVAASLLAPGAARAGGLFVPGHGPTAQARAGAFVARADDPSALYHNPAGFMKMKGTVVTLGANLIDYDVTFARAGQYEYGDFVGQDFQPVSDQSSPAVGFGGFQAIPLIAVSTDFGQNLPVHFGFGVMAPHGFPERDFAPEYNFEEPGVPAPPQRYDVMKQQALTIMPTVAVAYRVLDNLDVGARASWGVAEIKATTYTWGQRNYEEDPAYEGVFALEAQDTFVPSFAVGALYRPASMIELGATYQSKMTIDAKGTGSAQLGSELQMLAGDILPQNDFPACAPGGTVGALKACIKVPLPQMATVGARYIYETVAGREIADIELDVRWENWGSASDYHVIVDGQTQFGNQLRETFIRHGFEDVFSFRLGGSYTLPFGTGKAILRGGAAYDTAAAPNSWQRVDLDGAARTTLAAGFGYQSKRVRVDIGGGYVLQPDRTVPACNPTVDMPTCPGVPSGINDRVQPDPAQPLTQPSQNVQSPFNGGEYSSNYVLLSLGVTAWF